MLETNQRSAKIKKNRRALDNTTNFDLIMDFPFGENTFSQEIKYTANLRSVGLDNIDSYDITINGLFFGSNIFDTVGGLIQINSNDLLTITVVKTDNTIPSRIQLSVELV
jgi:hypothetical protein